MRYEVGEIYDVPLDDLRPAPWNAPNRAEAIGSLVESIRNNGQLVPGMVTVGLHLIDGHRRHAALKEIGIPTMRVLICDLSQKDAYALVNSEQRSLSGREAMWAYALGGPKSGTPTVLAQVERLERVLGRPALLRMAEKGFGPGIDRLARWVLDACGHDVDDIARYRKAVQYIADNVGASNYLRAWKDDIIRPKSASIWSAIERGRPLPRKSVKQARVAAQRDRRV